MIVTEQLTTLRHRLAHGKARQLGYWEKRLIDEGAAPPVASTEGSYVERYLVELESG